MRMWDTLANAGRRIIPTHAFSALQSPYHWSLALAGALIYRFPSRHIKVIAVTGTKGKSSTTELINTILEKAGKKTALSNTIRFKVGDVSKPNLYKMSMPGRFFMQKLIRDAVNAGCEYVVAEMTSQGALLHRHRFIEIDTLVFTNISPEHIEAHGSFKNYVDAKLSIARAVACSRKKPTTIIANSDDAQAPKFLAAGADRTISFSIKDAEPYTIKDSGLDFTWHGTRASSPLSGEFNLYNILAAATCATSEGIADATIIDAIASFGDIPGRVEKIEAGQDFIAVVDYAHTPDSLEKLYKVFRPEPDADRDTENDGSGRLIAVLGGTGGGRDTWKRAEMGRIADHYCDEIILTDEDPYDEDPAKIVADVAAGITSKKPTIIMDRREAIREAVKRAHARDIVLISGKGTDPYIMGPNGSKIPWSDSKIAHEEISKITRA